jgi:flagellar biosynthesis protein FlhF
MKIKTFQAMTMTDALRTIKDELGPDAVILSTKSVKQQSGMFGLFGRTVVEVTAAIDFDGRGGPSAARETARPSSGSGQPAPDHPVFQDTLRSSLRETDDRRDRVSLSSASRPPRQEEPPAHRQDPFEPAHPTMARETSTPEVRRLAEEVRGLRQLVEASLQPRRIARRTSLKRLPPAFAAFHHDLVQAGLEPQAAEHVLAEAAPSLRPGEEESDLALHQAVHRTLARSVSVSGPLLNGSDQKKTVIFVGPTGVGKTTTIAKLAAHYTLNEKRSVSLITLDTYRVAAVEQLRMYAKVIGVTLDVALTKRDALDYIRRRSRSELILIDTAGRSPMDEAGLRDLRELVALDHPLETHLVLSSTTREQDLIGGVSGYAGIPITRLLFTKLDETRGYGGLFGMVRKSGLPLSYLSTGQNVPEDLEVARPERVADLVLGVSLKGDTRETLCGKPCEG